MKPQHTHIDPFSPKLYLHVLGQNDHICKTYFFLKYIQFLPAHTIKNAECAIIECNPMYEHAQHKCLLKGFSNNTDVYLKLDKLGIKTTTTQV